MKNCSTIQSIPGGDNFPLVINPKVNVLARLEFELGYYDVAAKHVSHYTTRTPSPQDFRIQDLACSYDTD